MTPILRASGRKGAFSERAIADVVLVVKATSLPPLRATVNRVQVATGWGTSTVRKALAEAVRRGLLERVGRTKGAWYRIPEVQ